MTHVERLELVAAVKGLLPSIRHTTWPSGLCADRCTGCDIQRSVKMLLTLLEKDCVTEQKKPDLVLTGSRIRKGGSK